MASFLNSVRQNFGRPSNKKSGSSPSPSPTSAYPPNSLAAPRVPPLPNSPSLSSTLSENYSSANISSSTLSEMPLFMKDAVQIFIVKGNYMTLAARPKSVETGEWLAHHIVEQFRLLSQFITVVQSSHRNAQNQVTPICNAVTCPTMTAGTHTYTWLDSNRNPTRLPAHQYIALVQKWISGKILDPNLFPTDTTSTAAPSTYASTLNAPTGPGTPPIAAGPTNLATPLSQLGRDWVGKSSGFPENFLRDCRNIYKQMFRVWAHLYWCHFENPFYHLDLERQFNSSFVHFVVVGTEFDLLTAKDLEPMQALLDKWVALKIFPGDSKLAAQAQAQAQAQALAQTQAHAQSQPLPQSPMPPGMDSQGQGQGHSGSSGAYGAPPS